MARSGERFRTEFQGHEFVLIKRERRNPQDGWVVERIGGKRDWISDWHLSHCRPVSSPPLSSDEEGWGG